MAQERILVVDARIESVALVADLLQPLGYTILSATSGREGITLALQEQPDLVLLDLNMPDMSGLQVLEALNRHTCPAPVILMSLYGSEDIVVQALRLGIRNYISKPFDINELLVTVEWALEEGRLRRERERLVIELKEANEKLTRRMRELATLQAVGRSVASLMPREKLLHRILEGAIHLTRARVGVLFLWDRERQQLRLEAIRQGETFDFEPGIQVQDDHALKVLQSGQPLWISGPARGTGASSYQGQGAESLLYVPIRLGSEPVGVMGVARLPENRALSPEMKERLTSLADYAAMALQNAALYDGSQRQARQLKTINHIAQMITSALDLEEVMRAVVRSVRDSLHVDTATLILRDAEAGELVFEVVLGDNEKQQSTFRIPENQGVVGWVVQNGQPALVNDVSRDARFFSGVDQVTGFGTRSILCVPLIVSDRVIGAIEAINKREPRMPGKRGRFTNEDQELLAGAAAFVAIAVENARLHAATRETIASQTLRDTVVTLSHHMNNPLQAILGAIELLKAELGEGSEGQEQAAGATGQILGVMEQKAVEISVVISVLRGIGVPESTVYLGSEQMLNIEQELRYRLASVALGA